MDKEKLNSKLKEMKKQAGINAKKTKDNLGKVFDKENVKENLNKAKKGVEKAVGVTMNSSIIKKMKPEQKLAVLGISAFIVIVIIALIGRSIFSPEPSIWCVTVAPKEELVFHSAGEVAEVIYSEKQKISKGDTLARLDDTTYRADVESTGSKLMEANLKFLNMENRLADMENSFAEVKLKAAESALESAITAFELSQAYEEQYRTYFENRMISESQYYASIKDKANAEAAKDKAERDLENAKQNIEATKKGFTEEEIQLVKDEANELTEQVARAKEALEGTSIIAQFDAYINRIDIKAGDLVEPNKPVCEVIDLRKIWLRGLVNKSMAESIKLESGVNVEFREIPNETFAGKIKSVDTTKPVDQKDGEDLYELRIELDKLGGNVMPGMEAVAIVVSN
jgi:multidrug resistance efflux pump